MRLTKRTYFDKDGMATTDRAKGVRLLGAIGAIVDDDVAKKIGLKAQGKPEDKMASQPRNKSRKLTIPVPR